MILAGNERSLVELFTRVGCGSAERADTVGVSSLVLSIGGLFEFSERAVLFWSGCTRTTESYDFPAGLRAKWKQCRAGRLDARMHNGPPNSAFALARGRKPSGWELDHIYDEEPLWSVRDGLHFTQSAGLAARPQHAHRRRHTDPMLTWLVRGVAFVRFGYDPLRVFSTAPHDCFGFIAGRRCEVFWPELQDAEILRA